MAHFFHEVVMIDKIESRKTRTLSLGGVYYFKNPSIIFFVRVCVCGCVYMCFLIQCDFRILKQDRGNVTLRPAIFSYVEGEKRSF